MAVVAPKISLVVEVGGPKTSQAALAAPTSRGYDTWSLDPIQLA